MSRHIVRMLCILAVLSSGAVGLSGCGGGSYASPAPYKAELKDPLTTLGMELAFDKAHADLSGIADQTYIAYVRHKTFLKMDEAGTEATAVTAVEEKSAGAAISAFQVIMDHPFFCAIRDDKTGELLFMGCIVAPSAPSRS